MPAIKVSIETLAETIKKLNKKDLEILTLLLSNEGKELLKRKKEIEEKSIKILSREEAMKFLLDQINVLFTN